MISFKNPKKVTESIGLRKDSEQIMPGYMNFWVKDGVTLRPHFPFKPKLQISLLETIEKMNLYILEIYLIFHLIS